MKYVRLFECLSFTNRRLFDSTFNLQLLYCGFEYFSLLMCHHFDIRLILECSIHYSHRTRSFVFYGVLYSLNKATVFFIRSHPIEAIVMIPKVDLFISLYNKKLLDHDFIEFYLCLLQC